MPNPNTRRTTPVPLSQAITAQSWKVVTLLVGVGLMLLCATAPIQWAWGTNSNPPSILGPATVVGAVLTSFAACGTTYFAYQQISEARRSRLVDALLPVLIEISSALYELEMSNQRFMGLRGQEWDGIYVRRVDELKQAYEMHQKIEALSSLLPPQLKALEERLRCITELDLMWPGDRPSKEGIRETAAAVILQDNSKPLSDGVTLTRRELRLAMSDFSE